MNRQRRSPSLAASLRRPLVAALIAAAAGSATLAPRAAEAQGAGDNVQRVKELHKKGQKAYDAGDLRTAYEAYLAAWSMQKSYDIAGNLASVELDTARYREAAEHIMYALANLPVSGNADKRRAALTAMFERARKEIGVITIRVDPASAAVTLDGRPLGAPPLPEEIFVDPGEHTVAATAPDLDPAEQKVRLERGGSSLVLLTLKKKAPPIVVPPPATGPRPLTIAGFSVAGAGVLLGASFAILSKVKADDAASQHDKLPANACAGAQPSSACTTLHDTLASRGTFANAAFWSFIGAGALAAGTLVYTLAVPSGGAAPAKTATFTAGPLLSPGGGGFVLQGAF